MRRTGEVFEEPGRVRGYRQRAFAGGVFLAALVFLGACSQTHEAPAPESKDAVVQRRQASPAPASLARENDARRDVGVAQRGEALSGLAASYRYPPIIAPQGDRFPDKEPTGVLRTAEHPVSTFSIDVDTASYAFVRRNLVAGRLPPREAVRVEEMINYFRYDYAAPRDRREPFRVTTSVMPSPWSRDTQLLHVALRGYDVERNERPRANIVLLIDTSGSMQPQDRLPLLQQGFRLFAQQLRDDDRVALVTYAGQAQTALEPTSGKEKHKIIEAIDNLRAGGSTAGGEGLRRAYALAERHFQREAVNRVILATDGDFNVGITDPKELERFIVEKRRTGIYLSIFGVGIGNLNDNLMQRLAQAGNGNAAHIDSLLEARKAMSEELTSTLFPIADDVKVQLEFNPAQIAEYRLIGYETRMLRREDFNDDRIDAGDVGAGHTVTAIYEITPVESARRRIDPLRYGREGDEARPAPTGRDELAFIKLRYKLPGEKESRLIERPVRVREAFAKIGDAPAEQRFAVAVAGFAQRLRGEAAVDGFSYSQIADLANSARGNDSEGYRAEFVRLVRIAQTLGAVAQR